MSESHASRYRPLRPGPTRGGPPNAPPPRVAIPKRSVVKTACDACRQRKAKCDGRRPKCSACIVAGRECVFAAHPYESQVAAIKRKHDELQEQMVYHENLYTSLKTRQSPEAEEILSRIRAGGDVKSVTEDIREGNLLLQFSSPPASRNPRLAAPGGHDADSGVNGPWAGNPQVQSLIRERRFSFGQPPRARLTSPYDHPEHVFEETWRETQYRYAEDSVFVDLPGYTLPISRWTTVSNDEKLLNHLFLLFWTWDIICNRAIDRTIFEEDLRFLNPSSNPPDLLHFCSPFLVNALLAVSCLYTKNPATFDQPGDSDSRGQAFAKEAERLLALEDTSPSLPVAQGLALIRMQARYLALRLDNIPRSTDAAIAGSRQRKEAHALSWISWGFYVLDWKPMHGLCRRLVIKKPNRLKSWNDETTSPLCKKDNPDYWWFPYPVSVVPQKSLKREIFEAECDLTEITEQVLEFLIPLEEGCLPRRNAQKALELYKKLTQWKFSLPERLRAENAVLPAAILLHVSVELIIISLFRPFDGLSKEEFGPFEPNTMSYAHASNVMSTLWHFRALYTLRNEQWMVQAASVCAFRVLFDIEASPIQLETFVKACRALIELSESFPVAKDVLLSIESVVKKQRLELPSYAQEHFPRKGEDVGDSIEEYTVVKVRDHSVIVQKADSAGHSGHLTLSGVLSMVAPGDLGP
ncbi:hypothetical protein B0J15DRAFT_503142, partial [Fusarium solani]